MPDRPTTLTAAAGEHYVAYQLSRQNRIVALPRAGVPSIDILVSALTGTKTVGLQVKTSSWAWREYKKDPTKNHWEFDVGAKAVGKKDPRLIYVFVSLSEPDKESPRVFIVPSDYVCDKLGGGYKRNMVWVMKSDQDRFEDKWDMILDLLKEEPTQPPKPTLPGPSGSA
jgi:hypothetical protein